MQLTIRRIAKGIRGIAGSLLHSYPVRFDYTKKELLDTVFRSILPRATTFADLGGVWGIDGAYTFYLLDNYQIRSAFLVDTDFSPAVSQRKKRYDNLILINQNFGHADVPLQLGQVDAIILFDVLLHQVQPDWNEILEMYSSVTKCIVVYNQQFVKGETTVRLPELGPAEYFNHVPMDRNSPGYKNLFERPDEIHPLHKKPWRDVHNVWQWGITDRDLTDRMKQLGFETAYQKNHGKFSNFRSFENHAFVFVKDVK